MQKYWGILLLTCLMVSTLQAQVKESSISKHLALVSENFQAERAFETTRFVSEQWRVPGNAGFDTSIHYVLQILKEAGFAPIDEAKAGTPHYRLERYPLRRPTWEPIAAQLKIKGQEEVLLDFSTNRNMVAINSFSTPNEGLEAEVVYLQSCSPNAIKKAKVKGKIVMGDCSANQLFRTAVMKQGAVGVLAYSIPNYNQPENYPNSIPFRSISFNSEAKGWAINLSYGAREALKAALEAGPLKVAVDIKTKIYPSEELTLIAEIPGQQAADERFVFSAHVQEPGANDNASGVGTLAEMARVAIQLHQQAKIQPQRTITFLWGDEIRSTRRYIQQDSGRAKGIKWGVSLDMVGEDTEKTGGTFLIEKMPDPSAIWTRGEDKHSEWGATKVGKEDLNPHYFNDYIEYVCRTHAKRFPWTVNTNPFEGGSDHQPFLNARIPGLLFWHFTDVFYHTDADRIDKVSPQTLFNVGTSALASALVLSEGGEAIALEVNSILKAASIKRLKTEIQLSLDAVKAGQPFIEQKDILATWEKWYQESIPTLSDILLDAPSATFQKQSKVTANKVGKLTKSGMAAMQSSAKKN